MAKKLRVNPEKLKSTLISIQSRFETGKISKMSEVGSMYTTGLIAALGIGSNGYVTKFNAPEKFTIEDLFKLADVSNTDIELIWKVVKKQASQNYKRRNISNLINPTIVDNSKNDG